MGARFVRLAIAGFKSFADPTTLDILPGLTGVVGPNGCGKSNVAEALRWAMGEANARTLRGGDMDDVIFAGSAHRPSRNIAEVALTIEGHEHAQTPGGAAELHVARRIERGAGSSYRVNGREARARDVQVLFADLASGARSSAMVSQGRVGALVNARPEERRAVLEEAAGITGLHARRAEAEMRLRAAEANVERAEDRRALLDRQATALQEQVRQALRYRVVSTALQETDALLLAIVRARARLAHAAASHAVAATAAEAEAATGSAMAAAADADGLRASLPGLRDAEGVAQGDADRARMALERLEGEFARALEALAAARQRHTQIGRDLAYAEGVLGDAEAADRRLVAEAAALDVEAERHPAALEHAQRELAEAGEALRASDEAAAEAASLAAQAVAEARTREQMLQQADARHRRVHDSLGRVVSERDQAAARLIEPARLASSAQQRDASAERLAAAREGQNQADEERVRAAQAASAARGRDVLAESARHKLKAETAALAEVLAVKDGERWPPMIDKVSVPPGLEAALGVALGEELAAAADPGAARHWTALPDAEAVVTTGRSLGRLVAGPPLLARALGAVGVVDSAAEGQAIQSALRPGECAVSADGGLWRWDGYTVRPGTPTAAAVRLRQRNRLNDLTERLDEAAALAAAARAERAAAEQAEATATRREHQLRQARREAEAADERARAAHLTLEAQATAATARHAALDEQARQLQPEMAAAAAALDAAARDRAAQPDARRLQAAADDARMGVTRARQREAAAARLVETLQRAEQARQVRYSSIGREREDRRMRAADLAGRVVDLQARLLEAAATIETLAATPDRAAAETARAQSSLAQAETARRATQATRMTAEQELAQLETSVRAADQAVYAARERGVQARAALEAAVLACDTAEARIAEREGALPPLPDRPEATAAAEDRARSVLLRLTRERDGMGPVNLRAEAEAEALGSELSALVQERDELGTAIAKLRGSIGHLNREGRERLSAVFQQVDRQFQALFSRLFGGGRAHLALVGSDDPLLAGLEIFAQPPGKKLTALSLLSGGEQALTALSLVFAIFRCNPAPLCVLDEVDAPLDDANVGRFCSLLTEMAAETGTRFLVVTHHQVTMAGMDRLYGVTMQERGVSRLLSVDLQRAAAMVDAIAAE